MWGGEKNCSHKSISIGTILPSETEEKSLPALHPLKDGQRSATAQKEMKEFPFFWSPKTMCRASCVDDKIVQNGFVELYFVLALKPLFPVSGGHIISVSVLIFVEVPLTMLSLKSFVIGRYAFQKLEKPRKLSIEEYYLKNNGFQVNIVRYYYALP